MAHEELKKNLQDITIEEFATAVGHVFHKQLDPNLAGELVDGFATEFPSLAVSAEAFSQTIRDKGVSPYEAGVLTSGMLVGLMALKEVIDMSALKDQFPEA